MAVGAYRVKALGLSQPSLFLKTSVFPGKRLQAARLCETSATTARSLTRYKKIKSFGVCPTSEDGAFLKFLRRVWGVLPFDNSCTLVALIK